MLKAVVELAAYGVAATLAAVCFLVWASKRGVRAWCWSDKIWHAKDDFLKRMPKSVLQSNWYYGRNFDLNRPPRGGQFKRGSDRSPRASTSRA